MPAGEDGERDELRALGLALGALGRDLGAWVKEAGPAHVALSAGLGLAGLAVGVPCVPGLTDNLIVGAAGALLPQVAGRWRNMTSGSAAVA